MALNGCTNGAISSTKIPPVSFKPVSHVIFDMDGLLLSKFEFFSNLKGIKKNVSCEKVLFTVLCNTVGTEDIYEKADEMMTEKYGVPLKMEVRRKVLGTSELEAATIIINGHNLPISPEQYICEVDDLLVDMLKEAELMDGNNSLLLASFSYATLKLPKQSFLPRISAVEI